MKLCCVVAVALLVLGLCSQGESQNTNGPGSYCLNWTKTHRATDVFLEQPPIGGSLPRLAKCCFSYYPKAIPLKGIKAYKMTHPDCTKKAVILITVKDRALCANPEIKPIQDIMDKVDDLFPTVSP